MSEGNLWMLGWMGLSQAQYEDMKAAIEQLSDTFNKILKPLVEMLNDVNKLIDSILDFNSMSFNFIFEPKKKKRPPYESPPYVSVKIPLRKNEPYMRRNF